MNSEEWMVLTTFAVAVILGTFIGKWLTEDTHAEKPMPAQCAPGY